MTYNYVEADTRREADERFEAATDRNVLRHGRAAPRQEKQDQRGEGRDVRDETVHT